MTDTRDRVLAAIVELYDENGYPPTYRELEIVIGVALSGIHYHVEQLVKENLVNGSRPHSARTLVPTAAGREYCRSSNRTP